MNLMVPIAMFGWPFLAIVLFAFWPKRRAMLLGLMISWLFLPMAEYLWPGPLKWTKFNAVSVGLLLPAILFDSHRLLSFRPRWFDLPALITCAIPGISAFANGLAVPDAATSTVNSILLYGVPYLLGRLYILDLPSILELTAIWTLGGLLYVPLCLYEVRMSPLLHYKVYGFFQHQWAQMIRAGGYRPIIFMQHGLAVAMWMSSCTVLAFGAWRLLRLKRLGRIPTIAAVLALAISTLLCKSAGALALAVVGCGVIELARRFSVRVVFSVLIAATPLYIVARTSQMLSADRVMAELELVFPPDRVASASDRLHQEDVLSQRAMLSPFVGWGPWGGFVLNDQQAELVPHSDSFWIITFGKYGIIGLAATSSIYLLPSLLLIWRKTSPTVTTSLERGSILLALIPVLAMLDNLSNYMPNPFFVLAAGAVAGLVNPSQRPSRPRVAPALLPTHKPKPQLHPSSATRFSKSSRPLS